ncbi:TIGR03089 family protein [Rudaeicoccus suwonensis]|uniref:Uncharacterized protein (TIGR03089 family) n=1 Tax=Rudaeicoccus suwonensis TaxID=657409 RepID=A0A561E915_9MICO|nr:TIGR03089 family protein [Rudaeicoccus suwonensis]TWE12103.1 uncharacterized protein (TIGR03089 family) [Rudaeicoccus suwonensis]
MTPDTLLPALLASDPSRPRVTFYDDARGERIELSGRVLGNWVAKAANWLQDECGAEPGSTVRLDLPPTHWRTLYWALAIWAVGATVSGDDDADVVISMTAGDLVEPEASLAKSEIASAADQFTVYLPVDLSRPAIDRPAPVSYRDLIRPVDAASPRTVLEGTQPEVLRTAADVLAADGSVILFAHEDTSRRAGRLQDEGVTAAV